MRPVHIQNTAVEYLWRVFFLPLLVVSRHRYAIMDHYPRIMALTLESHGVHRSRGLVLTLPLSLSLFLYFLFIIIHSFRLVSCRVSPYVCILYTYFHHFCPPRTKLVAKRAKLLETLKMIWNVSLVISIWCIFCVMCSAKHAARHYNLHCWWWNTLINHSFTAKKCKVV